MYVSLYCIRILTNYICRFELNPNHTHHMLLTNRYCIVDRREGRVCILYLAGMGAINLFAQPISKPAADLTPLILKRLASTPHSITVMCQLRFQLCLLGSSRNNPQSAIPHNPNLPHYLGAPTATGQMILLFERLHPSLPTLQSLAIP
jgi:hypothetical protein